MIYVIPDLRNTGGRERLRGRLPGDDARGAWDRFPPRRSGRPKVVLAATFDRRRRRRVGLVEDVRRDGGKIDVERVQRRSRSKGGGQFGHGQLATRATKLPIRHHRQRQPGGQRQHGAPGFASGRRVEDRGVAFDVKGIGRIRPLDAPAPDPRAVRRRGDRRSARLV